MISYRLFRLTIMRLMYTPYSLSNEYSISHDYQCVMYYLYFKLMLSAHCPVLKHCNPLRP